MGILGTLLYIATAGWIIYFGYTVDLNFAYLLAAPVGFIFGHILRRSTRTSRLIGHRRSNVFVALVKSYLVGLVITAICFGIGYGLMMIMTFRPPEGTGRI